MGLDNPGVVDAVGTEKGSGVVVLSIIDSWDWADERKHLVALQEKLNAYFAFLEDGQLEENYPDAQGAVRRIDLVPRFPLPPSAIRLLTKAAELSVSGLGVEIRFPE